MDKGQLAGLPNEIHANGCSGPFEGEVASTSLASAYSLNWSNPPAGQYYVVLIYSGGIGSIVTPVFLVATSTQEQTSTILSVTTAQMTFPVTQIMTSLQVSQITTSNPVTSIPGFPIESLLVGLLIGLAILLLKRPRKSYG
jgi:hypothetical protein